METIHRNHHPPSLQNTIAELVDTIEVIQSSRGFIEANTIASSLQEIQQKHIIPVFVRNNEPVISHCEFIETAMQAVAEHYPQETILSPNIRLSHPIKGRMPEAKNKPAKELSDAEKTIYYERMAFMIEVPSIYTEIDGNRLNLTIGGVKAYNLDNLYTRNAEQHFKVFIGFKNTVCTNLCISTDGLLADLKLHVLHDLHGAILKLLHDFDAVACAQQLQDLHKYELTDRQFAQLIGRCKMYHYLPSFIKRQVPELLMGDAQINAICRSYYDDSNFCCDPLGSINLWRLYNLFTGANKSSYIDSFLDRSVNALSLMEEIRSCIVNARDCWYLN